MLDQLLLKKLFDAAVRENMDLNDPEVQAKLIQRKDQIEKMLVSIIEQNTKYCGCGAKNEQSDN